MNSPRSTVPDFILIGRSSAAYADRFVEMIASADLGHLRALQRQRLAHASTLAAETRLLAGQRTRRPSPAPTRPAAAQTGADHLRQRRIADAERILAADRRRQDLQRVAAAILRDGSGRPFRPSTATAEAYGAALRPMLKAEGGGQREVALAVAFGRGWEPCGVTVLAVGTENEVTFSGLDLVALAEDSGAAHLAVVHSHPHRGRPAPSDQDRVMEAAVADVVRAAGYSFAGSLIVSDDSAMWSVPPPAAKRTGAKVTSTSKEATVTRLDAWLSR